MSATPDAVLDATLNAASSVSQAARGWILARSLDGTMLEVVAATSGASLGTAVSLEGSAAGYVASLGQPLAVVLRSDDQFPNDVASLAGGARPTSVLCVPCEYDDALVGVLQLVDTPEGTFSFDDVELVTVIGGIVGAALASRSLNGSAAAPPDPVALGQSLVHLAENDPAGYRVLGPLLGALLADG